MKPHPLATIRTAREIKQIDRQIESIFYRRCSGIPINIMDISKVYAAAYVAHSGVSGQDMEAAIVETVNQLRQDKSQ